MSVLLWYWVILASVFTFGAAYTWLVWWQVRGIRGMALGTMQSCMALIASMMAMIAADAPLVSPLAAVITIRIGVWVVAFAALVLSDIYAADHNDHRSLTTITYLWWKRLAKERGK